MADEQQLEGMPAPRVTRVDKVAGTLGAKFVEIDDLPEIGDERKLGSRTFVCSSITETEKDGASIFTCTWKVGE